MLLSKALKACLFRPVTATPGILYLYHHLLTTTPVLWQLGLSRQHNISPSLSASSRSCRWEQNRHNSTSTQTQTESAPPESDSAAITITTHHGKETRYIKRSYPKGKPEKLIRGLERLLSSRTPQTNIQTPSNFNTKPIPPRWLLSSRGDAIHRALTLSTQSHVDKFTTELTKTATDLGHDPHITQTVDPVSNQHVLVVTCTTHVPHGLSLKDVKLADAIDGVVARIAEDQNPDDPSAGFDPVATENAEIRDVLIKENEALAEQARGNPSSKCAVGGMT